MSSQVDPTGVLLLNLGGPDSPAAVQPFLFNLFSDREIIRLGPAFLQKPIAWLISVLRSGKTRAAYGLIGGRSPINEMTRAQAAALEQELNRNAGQRFVVTTGMRYWHPYIEEAVDELQRKKVRRAVVIGLYPQYSVATTGSSLSRLCSVLAGREVETSVIDAWCDEEKYLAALAGKIDAGLRTFDAPAGEVHVLFSAHSLPTRFIEEGDPYVEQTEATIAGVVKRVPVSWSLSYQSRSGPVKWLEPSTDEMLHTLAGRGVKNLLVVPISFVSDHIETLYEIDILYRKMAEDLGMHLRRTESLNTDPLFITALQDLVMKGMEKAGWRT